MADDGTRGVRFSIVVPLYDRRDAGDRALASALDQRFPRDRFEIIAVVDANAPTAPSLVSRCTLPVAVDADFTKVESEIALYAAGARAAHGDYLFFVEAHTVLDPGALQAFDEHLQAYPDCAIVCGRRRNHARTALGSLVSMHNDAHEQSAQSRGDFALGANCIIRRDVFERLGGLESDYMRFAETVLYERARKANARIDMIDTILCTHHNDVPFTGLVRLLLSTGRARARYYRAHPGALSGGDVRRVYRWLDSRTAGVLAALPFGVAGLALVAVAMATVRVAPSIGGGAYRVGIGCMNVAGFCFERARASPPRRALPTIDSVGQDT